MLVANHAGDEAHDAIGHDGGCQLATGQNIIANGDFLGDEVLTNAVVNALVMATQDDDVFLHREFVGHGLIECFAIGRGEDYFVVIALCLECRNAIVDGLALHHHAGETTKGIVVHTAVLIGGIVTKVMDVDFNQTLLLSSA